MSKEYLIDELLTKMISEKAEDLHLSAGLPPTAQIAGDLRPLPGFGVFDKEETTYLVSQLFTEEQIAILYEEKELNSLYEMDDKSRFRVNAYFEKGRLAVAIRLILSHIPTLDELNLPHILYEFCKLPQGLVVLSGASGMGKSSTAAAMINWINQNRSVHIVTIEDPIEYIFESDKSLIHQRELYVDTLSWTHALKASLRESADVIFIGEIQDTETMLLAITAAEMGHLVITSLHSYSTVQTVDRIAGMFPEQQQSQVRMQLASVVEGIINQTLVRGVDSSKRYPAVEIMIANSAIRNTIREGHSHFLHNLINTSGDLGMITMEKSLAELVINGKVNLEDALTKSTNTDEIIRYTKIRSK
ncbi:type IV pili twitching motility protein PilT [candidate division WWE3 bacterium CG_4_9_14_0_2_um_filter_35_11]|uniref:Type IV pili twitching motility protein PilT n=1 Tax=candidate division WWE3 bacterium CG_4_9_14_0_2_um_filter_35_11 TaxID=1975077 RepID=A0A2M8EMQ2_UNCKA|nr:MAG: type IV pili twitching motility protein PilT [candidate division WWE3 bacterium CG10_big_fil_rev_8_21_14_0_10_35_32]PJC24008.1 MAG: type IV pili twitching motility protein PilT [candidate division WWE3 bacterium CG_4_9_14_0_2_um_filter_35_11]